MKTRRFAALLLGVVVATQGLSQGQSTYVDDKFGYSVKNPSAWDAVPPQPTDRYIVAKWVAPREIRDLPAEMHVYVFNRKAEDEKPDLGGAEVPAALAEFLARAGTKKSYAEWIKTDIRRKNMKLGKGRKLKVKGPKGRDYEAKFYRTTRPSGYSRGAQQMPDFYVEVAIITTEDVEYAVEVFGSEKAKRKLTGIAGPCIKGFKLLDWSAPVAKAENSGADGKDDKGYERTGATSKEEARERAREQAKRNKGWWYYETERYIIVTNVKKKRKPFIKNIGTRLEAIRDRYEIDFPPAAPINEVSTVRVCKDPKSYSAYGGPGGSAGYWYAPAKELVFFREGGEKSKPFAVLNHEAFHQYIYYACGEISPHSWYNEGYGDYYGGAKLASDHKRVLGIDPFKWRVDTIRSAIRKGTHVPLKDIIKYSQGQYYSNASLCYAEGWSIVYFLNTGIPKKHAWRSILPTYLDVIQKTKDKKKAVEAAFKGVDLDKLEKAWGEYIVRGTKLRN